MTVYFGLQNSVKILISCILDINDLVPKGHLVGSWISLDNDKGYQQCPNNTN